MNGLSVVASGMHKEPVVDDYTLSGKNRITAGAMSTLMRRINCPLCKRRVFDVSMGIVKDVGIEIKCPHCHRIVTVTIGGITL